LFALFYFRSLSFFFSALLEKSGIVDGFYSIPFLVDCEVLILLKDEFNLILRETLEQKHDNIRRAMRRFEYFDNYTQAKVNYKLF
jgi:hypothetical protein